jgi:lipid-A-disaccharide synthase
LEAAILGLPYTLVYKVAWPTYVIGKRLIRVPHLGMVNILAGEEIVKELIQGECRGPRIAEEITRLLEDESARQKQLRAAALAIAKLGGEDAYAAAGRAVAQAISL